MPPTRSVIINPESSLDEEDPEKQFRSFGNFLTDSSMIKFGVALVISLQLKQIVENITDSILAINNVPVSIFEKTFSLPNRSQVISLS
jgi:hypothetical protein